MWGWPSPGQTFPALPLTTELQTTADSSRQLWILLGGNLVTKSHSFSLVGWPDFSLPPVFQGCPNSATRAEERVKKAEKGVLLAILPQS